MARIDDLEQVNFELEDFRARSQETLKTLDQLADFILEFSKLKKDFESKLRGASESLDKLDQYTIEVESRWSILEPETRKILEQLKYTRNDIHKSFNDLKQETDQHGKKLQEDTDKAKVELHAALDNVESKLDQSLEYFQDKSENRYTEINQNLDNHRSRLEEFEKETDQRWMKLQEDITNAQSDFQIANRNLRNELGRMINDLRSESEIRFLEFNNSVNQQKDEFSEVTAGLKDSIQKMHDELARDLEVSRQEYKELFRNANEKNTTIESQIHELRKQVRAQLAFIGPIVIVILLYIFKII